MLNKIGFINKISPHVFWDVEINQIDYEKNAVFIIQRVVQYGLLKDWQLIKSVFGIENLKTYVVQIPQLDDVSLSFLSNSLEIEKSHFKCYKKKQLNPNYWNY